MYEGVEQFWQIHHNLTFDQGNYSNKEMHMDLHTMCLILLSDFNQNWKMSTNSIKILQYKIL